MARVSTGQLHEPVLRQLQGRGQGQADARPLWLQATQLCHDLIYALHTDAAR